MDSHFHGAHPQDRKKLLLVLTLTSAFMVIEAVAGWMSGSLALWADAGHMFADVAALSLSAIAMYLAIREPTDDKTYGYYRAEILAAVVNAVTLLFLAGWILYEAVQRFREPNEVSGLPVLLVGGIGLGVNVISIKLLGSGSETSLNIRSAYLEVISDAITSVGVIVGGSVIWLTGWYPIDPLISAVISCFIVWRTWRLLMQGVNILMEGVPSHLNAKEIGTAMASIPSVKEVHDLHIWTITSGRDALSAHIVVSEGVNRDSILLRLQDLLRDKFNIEHTTLQMVSEDARPIRLQVTKPPS